MHCFGISSNINLYNEFAKSQLICEWLHVKVFHLRSFPANMRLDEDIFRLRLIKTSWSKPIYLSWPYAFKTSSRRFQGVFKTFSRHPQDIFPRRLQDVFKTSWRRLEKTYSWHKYVWYSFWKGKRSWWESKQNECLCRSSRPKGSLKKVYGKFGRTHKDSHLCQDLFFW